MVDPGARLGVDGRLDDEVMRPYLRDQRWFGAHEREVTTASLVDAETRAGVNHRPASG